MSTHNLLARYVHKGEHDGTKTKRQRLTPVLTATVVASASKMDSASTIIVVTLLTRTESSVDSDQRQQKLPEAKQSRRSRTVTLHLGNKDVFIRRQLSLEMTECHRL